MQEETVAVGRTAKKKFWTAIAAGFLAFGAMVAVFGMNMTAVAMPLGGMGDFYVELDELQGEDFHLAPHIGETGEEDEAPMVRNEIGSVDITNLHIYKDLRMPGTENWIRINITSPNVSIDGLIQDARLIDADLDFDSLAIEQSNTDEFTENWTQNAETITITDAKIVTDYLFQSAVSLEGAEISVEEIDEPEMTE
ncbi:hypothetical protein EPH95_13415 [Salicibibacter halophilus]|uniref:Uncharacterized protein n=1 Tax=Salicibibacter halophilus TaxID=2502791 RepID=A0A514LKI8_9BACI|nr:DUF6230 family protein [Salicibibacter halophilus]QDI92055.1 hypothetical protein EPH95_13415 [Salicibibacter halophilus]